MHPPPPMGILDHRRCAMQDRRHHHSRNPAAHEKDIVYRAQSAHVKAMVCVDDDYVCGEVEKALPESPSIENIVVAGGTREGWTSYESLAGKEMQNR